MYAYWFAASTTARLPARRRPGTKFGASAPGAPRIDVKLLAPALICAHVLELTVYLHRSECVAENDEVFPTLKNVPSVPPNCSKTLVRLCYGEAILRKIIQDKNFQYYLARTIPTRDSRGCCRPGPSAEMCRPLLWPGSELPSTFQSICSAGRHLRRRIICGYCGRSS